MRKIIVISIREGVKKMLYWIVLVFLLVLIIVTTILTIVSIVKERKEYKREREEEKIRNDRPIKKSKSREVERKVQETPTEQKRRSKDEANSRSERKKPRRWKIIFENLATGDTHNFIFTESIGIGRTTQDAAFEKFLSLSYDKKISKVHCSIECEDNSLYLRDEGSKNHTYLNGKRVQRPILIQKEDIISIGETDLEIVKILREAK